uniref:Uncharacterized protein n=1 Tax=Oryza nivara TaxID=4536 RepID=A0A0E0H3X2_ORYNI
MDGSPAPRYLRKSLFRMQVLKSLEVAHGSSRVGVERLADSPESGNGHWIHPSVTTTDRSLHTRGVGRWRGGGICAGGGRVPDPPLTSSRPVDPRMWRAEGWRIRVKGEVSTGSTPPVTAIYGSLCTGGAGRWRGGRIYVEEGRVQDPPLTSPRPVDPHAWGAERQRDHPCQRERWHRIGWSLSLSITYVLPLDPFPISPTRYKLVPPS